MTQLLIVNQIWIDIKYDEILLNNTKFVSLGITERIRCQWTVEDDKC